MIDLISRQAAIDAVMRNACNTQRIYEAIKGLPAAQSETHDKRTGTHACDCISRTAAIDATWFEPSYTDPLNVLTEVRDRLKALPSAQPERIKGHWVEIASSNHTYKCSVCGRLLVNITDGKNNVAKNYPYCHCGADMRGEQDE